MTGRARIIALAGWLAACGSDLGDLTPGPGGTAESGGSAGAAGDGGTDAGSGGAGAADARDDVRVDGATDGRGDVRSADAARDSASDVSAGGNADARSDGRVDATVDVALDVRVDVPRDVAPDLAAEGGADAPLDVPNEVAAGATTNSILSAKSADCLACAQEIPAGTNCELSLLNCESLLPAAPAQAASCIATLQCVVPSSCVDEANSNLAPCYCGTVLALPCLTPGAANGVCKGLIETGLASTDPAYISGHLSDMTVGTGLAMQLMQCLADYVCQSCF